MKPFLLKAMIIFIIASTTVAKAADLVIVSASQQAKIYVQAGYTSVSMQAAYELQRCIFLMTGKTLEIITTSTTTSPQIVIGTLANPLIDANKIALGLDGSNINEEKIAVLRSNNNLFLAGKSARAALYATYTFLQDYLGVRWFWPGESGEYIPKRTSISINTLSISQVPKLPIRTLAISNAEHGSYPDTELWMARNKMNVISAELGDTATAERKRKGFLARISGHNIVLPKDSLTAHPSWAALRDNNRLIIDEAQLCWGNTDLQTAIANMIKGWWTDNPDVDIAHIYPADNQLYCQDALCQSLGSDVTTRWQNFTKAVIAKVNLTHPGKRYWTYAYQQYKGVPGTTAAPFEFVGYALYEACYKHDFMSSSDATNNTPNSEISGWLTKNVNMGIRGYEYIMFTDPMFVPLVKWEVDQMDWIKNNGLVGYMSELRPYGKPSGNPENTNWNTNRINLYAAAKAMWGTITADSIVNDWNNTVYGIAGSHMRDYYKTFDTAWRNSSLHLDMYNNSPANHVDDFLSIPKLIKLNNHIRMARTSAETGVSDSATLANMNAQLDLESKMLLNWQTIYNYKKERAHKYKSEVPKITGTINWSDPAIPQLTAFENSSGQEVTEPTEVKMIWNTTNLVLRIVCHDNNVAGRVQAATSHDDADILTDDRVEIYLQKNPDSREYVRFAVNAKSGIPWRYDATSKGGTNFITSWTPSPAWSATNTVSTDTWTTTITIPLAAIGVSATANTTFKMMIKRGRPEGNSGWPDGSFYNQNSFGLVKLVNTIENPLYNRLIMYDNANPNRFPISVEFQKRNWQVSSGVSGETALEQKLNEDAAVLLIKHTSTTPIGLSSTFFQNEVTDFISKGRLVIISGSNVPINSWLSGLPTVSWSNSINSTPLTVDTLSGQWLRLPNNIRTLVMTGLTPVSAYIPATGWRKLATRGMQTGSPQPYLLTYQIGDGLLVLTSSALGYSGGFEMFGSNNPINTVKLVENLRALQDSINSYSSSAAVLEPETTNIDSPREEKFKIVKTENTVVYTSIESAKAESAQLRITDISGRTLADMRVSLQKGVNRINIPAAIKNGNVYIATLKTQERMVSIKFLKNSF